MNRYNNLSSEYEDYKRRVKENEMKYNQNLINIQNESNDAKRRQEQNQRQLIQNYEKKIVESENRIGILVQEI